MSARGVWGDQERARAFLNQANAEACLSKLQPGPDASLELAALEDLASGNPVVPDKDPSVAGAALAGDGVAGPSDPTLITG